MKRLSLLALALCTILPLSAAPESKPMTADQLMARVRYSSSHQKEQKLDGNIDDPKSGEKVPFGMQIKNNKINFSFSDDKGSTWKAFELRLNQQGQELYTFENGKATKFTTKRYTETLAGSKITYEDLSLRFLYWPKGTIHAQSKTSIVKGRSCHIVDLPNPTGSGAYSTIRVWIDQENGAFWRIHAFDKQNLVKTFDIDEVMKTGDTWFFKRMIVKTYAPGNAQKATSINYINMKKNS